MNREEPLAIAYALTKYHQLTQTFVDLEIRELRRRGHDVWVVAMERGHVDRSADSRTIYLDALVSTSSEHIRAHASYAVRHPIRYIWFLILVALLRSELGAGPEEVPWFRLPNVVRPLERARVRHVHSHFGWSGAAAAALTSALLGTSWSMTLHAKDIFTKRRNLRVKLSLAHLVITVSDYNRQWLASHGWTGRHVEVLTCGIEPAARVKREGQRGPTHRVVSVGRLIPKKGMDVVIRACALASERRPVEVEIVGAGPLRQELDALVEHLGISDICTFVGDLPHAEALRRIEAADVFCLACRVAPDGDRDAAPTVLIEAMMRGVPVVTTRVSGIPEIVDSSCGRLADEDDVGGVAAAIAEILDDEALARSLGEAAARRAREAYALEVQVARLFALIEDATGRTGIRRLRPRR